MPDPDPTPPAGTATWVIPLQVTVALGGAVPANAPPPAAPPPAPPSPSKPAVTSDLDEAVAELERAATRPYYVKADDDRDRGRYYPDDLTALKPGPLFRRLHDLLESTHARKPAYKPMTMVYPWVDLQPNLKLKSVYSGQQFDPLEFIRDDAETARRRDERVREFRATEATATPELEAAHLEMLEAALPYNCEHVVPQSWFRKKEPMRGDLHHLFACESGCNSFRGNIPYYDWNLEAVRAGCGRREADKFEPTAGKGAVARATLYFLLRYPGLVNSVSREYDESRLAILLAWHEANKVGEYEKHRNHAIFAAQGNRNPLIDFPDLVQKIDFLAGL